MNPQRDGAERALAVAVTFLPARQRQWGAAMQAELAAITDPRERSSFARSCVRASCVTPLALCGLVSRTVVGAIAVAAVAFMTKAAVGVEIQAAGLLVVLAGLAVAGTRSSRLGPVADSSTAGCWRMTGYLFVGTLLLWLLQPRSGGPTHDPGGFWIAAVFIAIFLATTLQLTSRQRPRALLISGVTAIGAAALWSALMLGSADVRAVPALTFLVIAAAALCAARVCTSTGLADHVTDAAIATVFATSVLIFIATGLTYRAAPSLTPNVGLPGRQVAMTAAVRQEQNRVEALDPYVALLLVGAVAGLLTFGSSRSPTVRNTSAPRASAQ